MTKHRIQLLKSTFIGVVFFIPLWMNVLFANSEHSNLISLNDQLKLKNILDQKYTEFFKVSRNNFGQWSTGHTDSYYSEWTKNKGHGKDRLVFTASNGSLISIVSPNGELKSLCVFGEPHQLQDYKLPGGGIKWDRIISGPINFTIKSSNNDSKPIITWPCETSYLLNALPITQYQSSNIIVRSIACPPISADGSKRPRAVLWAFIVENISKSEWKGSIDINLPKGLNVRGVKNKLNIQLLAGAITWWPVMLTFSDDEKAILDISQKEPILWLDETCQYWKKTTGSFSMPKDPFTAELFTRTTVLSLSSGVFDKKGDVAGVLYGMYPLNGLDNFRDSYYAMLPVIQRDPSLLRRFIPWFTHFAERPVEPKYPDGISHSLGNSLSGVMLAGLYYNATGDGDFFTKNSVLVEELRTILDRVLITRSKDSTWLFPSTYISDGFSLGDHHTGSNICAWFAFKSFARILREVFKDTKSASKYFEISELIKIDLERLNIVNGPFGIQYVEGRNRDGSIPAMVHDGEESDTTLMPYYGYCEIDSPTYKNYLRFAMSDLNGSYNAISKGIVWEDYGKNSTVQPVGPYCTAATFPSYITGLASCTNEDLLRGKDGYLSEIRRLTDLNGSFWWWPYGKNPVYGKNLLRHPFESGWAEGKFAVIFQENFLGISYDGPNKILKVSPREFIGDFEWLDFPIGMDRFNVRYVHGKVSFEKINNK